MFTWNGLPSGHPVTVANEKRIASGGNNVLVAKKVATELIPNLSRRKVKGCAAFNFFAFFETGLKSFNAFVIWPTIGLPFAASAKAIAKVDDFFRRDVGWNDGLYCGLWNFALFGLYS